MTQHPAAPLLRSLLSVPAIFERGLAKVSGLDCDGVILDLEDSVPAGRKAEGRAALAAFLSQGRPASKRLLIRINDIASADFAEDVALVASAMPDGVLLPKVDDPRDLATLTDALAEAGGETLPVWAMVETPKAFLNIANLCEAARGYRLEGVIAGLNDLRKATRIRPLPGRAHLVGYLGQMVLAARAYGLVVIDSVSNDFSDLAAFARECEAGSDMGFDGKMLIHPAQITPANAAFSPRPDELALAMRVVDSFARPEAGGQGAISIDGQMVERLHLADAEALLARHNLIVERTRLP